MTVPQEVVTPVNIGSVPGRVKSAYPEKDLKGVPPKRQSKGNAVREGFDVAKGAVLMILDADLATPPEELPKFYEALKQNKGDFDLLFGAAKLNRKITEIIVRYKDGSMDRPRSAGSDTAGS